MHWTTDSQASSVIRLKELLMTVLPTATHQPWPGVITAYRDRLPVGDDWTW